MVLKAAPYANDLGIFPVMRSATEVVIGLVGIRVG